MHKVLITVSDFSKYCIEAKEMLEKNGIEIIENLSGRPMAAERFLALAIKVDAIIAGVDRFDENFFNVAKNLKLIVRWGTGVDNIDLEMAKEKGVLVTNAKGINYNAVAEFTVTLMLALLRKLTTQNNTIRNGLWEREITNEIKGKKVGIIGFGSIGQSVAKKLNAFECDIYAYDIYPNYKNAEELNTKLIPLEEILNKCDILSLNVPSTKDTYHLIGEKEISIMKDGVYLINTARGNIIDEKALLSALKAGKIRGAALDVYENEPIEPGNPLLLLNNTICSPHTAGYTFESFTKVGIVAAEAVIDVLNGRTPQYIINI